MRSGVCSMFRDVVAQPISEDEVCLSVQLDAALQWVENGVPQLRPVLLEKSEFFVPDDGNAVRLDVPEGTVVRYDGEVNTITDGVFEFEGDVPGEYRFVLDPPFPYQRQLVRIEIREIPAE